MSTTPVPRSGLATASIAVGAAAVLAAVLETILFAVPGMGMALLATTVLLSLIAGALGVIGAVLAAVALVRGAARVRAGIGLALSVLGVVLAIVLYLAVFGSFAGV